MTLWLTLLGIGVATFALRAAFLVRGLPRAPSQRTWEVLHFIPVAVLSALILPALLRPAGALDLSPGNARLVAGLLAVLVAWRSRLAGHGSAVLPVGVGMAALWILQALQR